MDKLSGIVSGGSSSGESSGASGPTEVKNASGETFLVKFQDGQKIKKTKNQFLVSLASDIFYSRDINIKSAKLIANNSVLLATTFYNVLKNSKIIKEYEENGIVVVEY